MSCVCHPEYHLLGIHQPGFEPIEIQEHDEMSRENHTAANSDARKRFEELRGGAPTELAFIEWAPPTCSCECTDPGDYITPPAYEQNPWCEVHPDVNQLRQAFETLAKTWRSEDDTTQWGNHDKTGCAAALEALLPKAGA